MMSRHLFCLMLMMVLVLTSGCSVWRGMPTHGGGKRFDEEQRVVAGSVRRTVADMNLDELRGRSVQIVVDAMSHNGGGSLSMPGLNSLNANFGKSIGTNIMNYEPVQIAPPGYYSSQQDYKSYNNSQSYGFSGNYQPSMVYNSAQFGSDADLNYLTASLNMKARHSGINLVGANPEYILFVLVDVLGINRSRRDNLIFWKDKLTATCEVTYYAVHVPTNQVTFRARQAKATGSYAEDSLLAFNAFHVSRSLESRPPDFLPVDASLSTQTLAQLDGSTSTMAILQTDPVTMSVALDGAVGSPDPARVEFAASRLRDADLQLRIGNLDLAHQNVQAVRAIAPDFPGLIDLELRLTQARQLRERAARIAAAPLPTMNPALNPPARPSLSPGRFTAGK